MLIEVKKGEFLPINTIIRHNKYVFSHHWEQQLIKKGLLTVEECSKSKNKSHSLKSSERKSAYEKELERENLRLRARLAYFQELERLIDEDKKNSNFKLKK